MSLEKFDQIISDYENKTGMIGADYEGRHRAATDAGVVGVDGRRTGRREAAVALGRLLAASHALQVHRSEVRFALRKMNELRQEFMKCHYSPNPGQGYLEAKDSFERLNLENQSGGKRRLKYYYNGGMNNLKPYSKKELEKLDRYMPGSWNFVQMEEDRIDEMPLNRSDPQFVCANIYDKVGFLEGWMRKVINMFQPNNPNIHLEIRGFFPNIPQKIFNYETLSRTIGTILGNTTPSIAAEANIKRFLKNIATGIVRVGGGIFAPQNNNQILAGEPRIIFEEIIVGPTETFSSYGANDIFGDWDVEVQGHELEGYNINIHKSRTGSNSVGGIQGPMFFAINGLNMDRIEEDLPEILEGINVLKKQVSRTCNVRSSRINRAGGKRKLLRWVKK